MNDKLNQLPEELKGLLAVIAPDLLRIGLLIILFYLMLPLGKKIISGIINKASKAEKLSIGRVKTLEKLLRNIYFYLLFSFLIITIFGILNIPIGPLLAGAGVVGLAIGFGAQGIVSDVVTGFFILLEWQLEIDDYVTIGSVEGIVEEIGLRTTKVRSFDGTLNYIPNRNIVNVANHSRGNMRALVDFTIDGSEKVDDMIALLEEVCQSFQQDPRFKNAPHVLGIQSMDGSNVVLRIVGQTENGKQWECERDVRLAIKIALENRSDTSSDGAMGV